MKKFISLFSAILLVAMLSTMLFACQPNTPPDDVPAAPENVSVYVPDGAPAMAIANIIKSGKIGADTKANVTLTTGQNVIAKAQKGEADIAVLPTNAAATVYNATKGAYRMLSVNVHGLLYLMGTTQIQSLSDLVGKEVQSIGLGNTPEYVFKRVLKANNLEVVNSDEAVSGKVAVRYHEDGSTIIPLFVAGKAQFAVLGEPAATNLVNKMKKDKSVDVYRLADLQAEWKKAVNSSSDGYPQACVIVKTELLNNATFLSALRAALADGVKFATESYAELAEILKGAGSALTVNYTKDLVERCNLRYTEASTSGLKQDVVEYLKEFGFSAEGTKPNNTLPDDAFFFGA